MLAQLACDLGAQRRFREVAEGADGNLAWRSTASADVDQHLDVVAVGAAAKGDTGDLERLRLGARRLPGNAGHVGNGERHQSALSCSQRDRTAATRLLS